MNIVLQVLIIAILLATVAVTIFKFLEKEKRSKRNSPVTGGPASNPDLPRKDKEIPKK